MWFLPAFSLLSNAAGRVYYRLTVTGERVPRTGPVLLVANHPNSLLDPILVVAAARRPVRFLAMVQLFKHPVWGWFMRGSGAIPVYRRIDDPALVERNIDMFQAVFDELSRGAAIGIFPEGVSHSEPSLASLKTGAARIALGAFAQRQEVFPVIPAGLVLREKEVFRSEAAVVLGQPIAWDDLATRGPEDQAAVRELTDRIDRGLRQVTVNLEQWADKPLVECAEEIWTAQWGADLDPARRVARLEVTTALLAELRREPGAKWTALMRDVAVHCRRLRRLRLRPAALNVDVRLQASVRWTVRRFYLAALPTVLVAAAGFILFVLPYRLTDLVDRIVRPPKDKRSTYKLFAGIAVYTLWVLLLMVSVTWMWNPLVGVGALVAVPLIGLAGLWVREQWHGAWHDARRFFRLRSRERLIQSLKEQQRDLAIRLKHLYEEWQEAPDAGGRQ